MNNILKTLLCLQLFLVIIFNIIALPNSNNVKSIPEFSFNLSSIENLHEEKVEFGDEDQNTYILPINLFFSEFHIISSIHNIEIQKPPQLSFWQPPKILFS